MKTIPLALALTLGLSGCAVGATGYASGALLPSDSGWSDPGVATVARIPPRRPEAQVAIPGDATPPRTRTTLVHRDAPLTPWVPSDPGWRAPTDEQVVAAAD
ncbi:MAG: hypothetical protein VYE22_37580 [Myxococcota bacterium]|nr:hypothetical protein [Myxococcota bacterium]